MAKLHFFYSTMNAGKSTSLLQTNYNFEENNHNTLLFLPNPINKKNNKSILKKLVQTKKVRSKIIKLKQDIDKPDFGRD